MNAWLYSGERRIETLDPRDRGLAYGDGVFETVLIHRGEPVWWAEHLARLDRGCAVLGFPSPERGFLAAQVAAMLADCRSGVLKLIVTRGVGERGYAVPARVAPTLVLSLADTPSPLWDGGIAIRWCDTRLAIQPQLAGIKHLNRLEQVLARAEWSDPGVHDGLQCDTAGRVVSATMANLFVLRDGRWHTPPVTDCGIAGICRNWLLEHVPGALQKPLHPEEVESADALVLCNSVRGILPVASLGERRWSPAHPGIVELRGLLGKAQPAFDPFEPMSLAEDA